MIQITSAANVENPALFILLEEGYEIKVDLDEDEDQDLPPFWTASKDDILIHSRDPIALLGLSMIAERKGDKWRDYPYNLKMQFLNEDR